MRIALTTLGCKINQYETNAMRQSFHVSGNTIVPFDAEADVYIINTCSVTAKSDYQCRQVIRSAVKRGNGAKVIVTGCYAETRPQELERIPGVSLIAGNRDKALLPQKIMEEIGKVDSEKLRNEHETMAREEVTGRTRGFLKIQDGCDNRCTYCIVPIARGSSRSLDPMTVTMEFERLVREGCPEIVLSGIHIGAYGGDLLPATSLTELLAVLISRRSCSRIRLSSIEPNEISSGIIDYLGTGLCRHLHIPLQSGDDGILSSMKRRYTAGHYLEVLDKIAKTVPEIALGADIMVGYPGETEKEFQNTFNLVSQSPLTHFHIFSYSPRPATPAAEMTGQVSEAVKKERNEMLRNLGRGKNFKFRRKFLGSTINVVVEDKRDGDTGLLTGLTDNYIRILISGAENSHIGRELTVRIEEVENERNFAVVL